MGKKAFLALLGLAVATPPVANYVYRNISPIIVAAKYWDSEEGSGEAGECPGKVIFTLRKYYFSTNDCPKETFHIYDSKLDTLERYPKWIMEGKSEVLMNYEFPKHVGMQARFAAKYLVMEPFLSEEAKRNIKVIGTAFFEYSGRFTPEQRALLKKALVFYLKFKLV